MTPEILATPTATAAPTPKIGFVSLGCPKALTDSELILTQLRAEGYDTSKTFAGADLVVVNTCGFIDDAVKESLDTIGEALAENGKVIVTGCLGAKTDAGGGNLVRQMHPSVLAVTGPHAAEEVMAAVHEHLPKPHVDDILPLMADGRILPYLDVPFQHSHPDVLKRMKRPASGERNLERLQRWRAACPQLVVRSTFIAGFPGETDEEFEHLLD